jgi:hypothetical protein
MKLIQATKAGVVFSTRRFVWCVCRFTDTATVVKRAAWCGRVALRGFGFAWLRKVAA